MRPRVGPPSLAAQPLPVEQVCAREFGPKGGTAQPVDRLAIPALSVLAVAEQRPGTRVDPLPPAGLGDAGRLGQPAERVGGELRLSGPAGRLDQFGKHTHGGKQLRHLFARLLRLGNRRLIAAETVVKNRGEPLRLLDGQALAGSPRVLDDGLDQRGGLGFCPRNPASHMAANGANRVPVAAAIASASAISEAAAAKSPHQVKRMAVEFT